MNVELKVGRRTNLFRVDLSVRDGEKQKLWKWEHFVGTNLVRILRGGPKSKPLPNYQKVALNRIKACQ